MSLSSRWSLFSRGGGDKTRDDVEGGDNINGVEEEFSVKKEEEEVVVKEEETVVETVVVKQEETVVETSCNPENYSADFFCAECAGVDADALYEKANECYLKMLKMRVAVKNDIYDNKNDDGNNHYKGIKTEVMPTMPVLFIEEFVPAPYKFGSKKSASSVTDLRAYIYYDSYRCVYVLNATRRRDDENGAGLERRYPDICMTFKSRSSLAFFLRRSTCSWKHDLSVTMYSMYRNVIHLTTCGAMPSFHSIHNCRTKFRTELFGYDGCHISMKTFESYLKVLKEGGEDGYLFR